MFVVPAHILESELAAIEAAIRKHPNGAFLRDLVGPEAAIATQRKVQRRLQKLERLGRVRSDGAKSGTRYYVAQGPTAGTTLLHKEDAPLEAQGGFFIPLTESGKAIQTQVSRPAAERTPVGYNRDFLSSYRPNETFYLSARERTFLANVGAAGTGERPAGTYAKEIYSRLLIEFAWNSSRLEGNKYSLLETHDLLERGKRADGKSAEDAQMLLNHKDAIEFIVEAAEDIGFNRYTILNLHALLSHNLLKDVRAEGRLRMKAVGISGSVFSPLETPALIEECFVELLAKAGAIEDPFEQAFFATVQLPYLQPFDDVNKRVARFAANIPFIRRNLSPWAFNEVPENLYKDGLLGIYELNRTELARDIFVWAYERSAWRYASARQSIGEPDRFRLRYREMIRGTIANVILSAMGKQQASKAIEEIATADLPPEDRERFKEVVSSELIGLHEGNIARYRVSPSQFYSWKIAWEAP
ncbi:MAG TPA: Fic family protein [Caulobacterales bacterium]|nr:Fic family protein [Caulobacterales bacterium]